MAQRMMRIIMGVLILIAQFLDPATRWLSWGIVGLLLFQGITNIQIMGFLFKPLGPGKVSCKRKQVIDKT